MRGRHSLVFCSLLTGCHLASGIDDIKIDRRVAEVEKEEFFCEPHLDEFEAIDSAFWNKILSSDRVDVGHDVDELAARVLLDDTGGGELGGLATVDKVNFNDCEVIVEVGPPMDAAAFAMVALMTETNEEPLIALRKEGSELIASRRTAGGSEDLQSIPFNANQRFWRLRQSGEQILYEHSEMGLGSWEPVGAVAKPNDVRAVHIALLVGTIAPVASDGALFYSYEVP